MKKLTARLWRVLRIHVASTSFRGTAVLIVERRPPYLSAVETPNRCKDANQHDPAKAAVRAVSFHPTGELLLTGGFDKTLRLFQVRRRQGYVCHLWVVAFLLGQGLCMLPVRVASRMLRNLT